jgi:transketolase
MTDADLDQLSVNTIRTLSIDAVQAENSGHPGTPMATVDNVVTTAKALLRPPKAA